MRAQVIFVVGTGRCGTHTLCDVLASNREIVSLHEGEGTCRGKQVSLPSLGCLNMLLNANRRGGIAKREQAANKARPLIDMEFESRRRLIEECEVRGITYAESNRIAYNYIPYIYQTFPEAKFIHVIRNPYECCESFHERPGTYPETVTTIKRILKQIRKRPVSAGEYSRLVWARSRLLAGRASAEQIELLGSRKHLSYLWEKPIPEVGDAHHLGWAALPRIVKVGWMWSHINQVIANHLNKVPISNRWLLRIEDISSRKILELAEFIKMPLDSRVVHADARSRKQTFPWDDSLLEKFNEAVRITARVFGYELQKTSRAVPPVGSASSL